MIAFVVLVGTGMILPLFVGRAHTNYLHMQCGKHQSQILAGMVIYSTSEQTGWPDPRGTMAPWKLFPGAITTATQGAQYSAGAFELIAASQNLPNPLFKCPSAGRGGPDKTMTPTLNKTSVKWGWNPAGGVAVSYAFDWASPIDPSANRVILADREVKAHRDFVMVVFGDGHVEKVQLTEIPRRPAGILITESVIALPVNTATGIQPDDDIYSSEGDNGDPLTPGKGDPLRAWVK